MLIRIFRSLALGLTFLLMTLGVLACASTRPSDLPPRADVRFINGKPDGPCVIYDGRGNVEARGSFKDGLKEGPWSYFDSKGNRLVEISWRAGKRHGPCRMWFGRGIDGGKWLGHRKIEMRFAGDQPEGMKRSWYPGGEKRTEVEYRDGVVRSARFWDPSGRERSESESVWQANDDWTADVKLFETLEGAVRDGLAHGGGQGSSTP